MRNETIVCPDCARSLTEAGQFWICAQHVQVSLDAPTTPLRIFLSYCHDGNEELVRRIRADLEQRGHDVWFDKSEIKELGITHGDDWRRAMTDGILHSNCDLEEQSGALAKLSNFAKRDWDWTRGCSFLLLRACPWTKMRVEDFTAL